MSTHPNTPSLHPALWVAAASITAVSLAGVAKLTGLLPDFGSTPPAVTETVATPTAPLEAPPPQIATTPAAPAVAPEQAAPAKPAAPAGGSLSRHESCVSAADSVVTSCIGSTPDGPPTRTSSIATVLPGATAASALQPAHAAGVSTHLGIRGAGVAIACVDSAVPTASRRALRRVMCVDCCPAARHTLPRGTRCPAVPVCTTADGVWRMHGRRLRGDGRLVILRNAFALFGNHHAADGDAEFVAIDQLAGFADSGNHTTPVCILAGDGGFNEW